VRYFRHMTNAQRDDKVTELVTLLGWEGYGIFFCTLELIAEQMKTKQAEPVYESTLQNWRKITGYNRQKLERTYNILGELKLLSVEFKGTKLKVYCANLRKYMQIGLGRARTEQPDYEPKAGPNKYNYKYKYNQTNTSEAPPTDNHQNQPAQETTPQDGAAVLIAEIVKEAMEEPHAIRPEERTNIPALEKAIAGAMESGLNQDNILDVMDRNRYIHKHNKDPKTGKSFMPSFTKLLRDGRGPSILNMTDGEIRGMNEKYKTEHDLAAAGGKP